MRSHIPPSMSPFLQRLRQHSYLTEEEAEAILGLPFHPCHVAANQDFVQHQERVTHSCFVLEGMVGTFGENKRGDRQITSFFVTGDMVDLHTVVVPEAPAAVQALVTSTILKVPHSALRELAGQHPGVAEAFWRQCVVDAAILSEWVVNVGRRDARSRMAHLFCELACRSGRQAEDDQFEFNFPISQSQLADMVGLTPVHVNRTLKGLREDRIVGVVNRLVRISNWDRLAQIGEFDPAYLRLAADGKCGVEEPRRVVSQRLQSLQ
jgi:CRP-like cAMP-binding protein